jgi:hypothetical protein
MANRLADKHMTEDFKLKNQEKINGEVRDDNRQLMKRIDDLQ